MSLFLQLFCDSNTAFKYNTTMKDLFTISIAGILLWWVAFWPIEGDAALLFQGNTAWYYFEVFSF
jgi:hypothetical protein